MNQKYKIYIILFSLLMVALLGYYFLSFKKEIIPFTDAKMIEGEIENLDNNIIFMKNSELEFDYTSMAQKEGKKIELSLYKGVIIEEYTADFYSEEEMQQIEGEYASWQQKPDSEKDLFSALFPPTLNKTRKISYSDLKKGDSVRVIYHNTTGRNEAVKIIKNLELNSQGATNNKNREISFTAKVIEVLNNKIKTKNTSSIDGLYQEGSEINIIVDNNTVLTKLKTKSDDLFEQEEMAFIEERQKIKEAGGNFLSLAAPSRYLESAIDLSQLTQSDEIKVIAYYDEESLRAINIQKIIK